jgi:hypothetical protein
MFLQLKNTTLINLVVVVQYLIKIMFLNGGIN